MNCQNPEFCIAEDGNVVLWLQASNRTHAYENWIVTRKKIAAISLDRVQHNFKNVFRLQKAQGHNEPVREFCHLNIRKYEESVLKY